MSQGLLTEWQRELNAEAYVEEFKKTQQELSEVKEELTQAHKSVSRSTNRCGQRDIASAPQTLTENIITPPQQQRSPL
jgi:predicted transcriptional regulator